MVLWSKMLEQHVSNARKARQQQEDEQESKFQYIEPAAEPPCPSISRSRCKSGKTSKKRSSPNCEHCNSGDRPSKGLEPLLRHFQE
ncbi:hypothetical protein PRNP1_000345 [Phytophthora ramorum]